jgi:competence protein ComEA
MMACDLKYSYKNTLKVVLVRFPKYLPLHYQLHFYYMWKQVIKDYFNFSKKERIAVLLLLTAIALVVLLPYWWLQNQKPLINIDEVTVLKKQLAQLNPVTNNYKNKEYEIENNYISEAAYRATVSENPVLFYFDPNQLPATGWKQLGLKDKTIQTIQNYLAKGGRFYEAGDLAKIYGLGKNDFRRLSPYVKIMHTESDSRKTGELSPKPSFTKNIRSTAILVDINTADTTTWIALPGIGSKLANRIVSFREKLGGFYSTDQVAEIYGLPDSAFQKIKPLIQHKPGAIRTININSADINILKQHPYIKWQLANAIVQYRQQHGNYQSIDDLLQITILTPAVFQKIKPYLVIE